MEPLPRGSDMSHYFETILPAVESHWSSRKNEVYLTGGGAAGGLAILATILDFKKNQRSGKNCENW